MTSTLDHREGRYDKHGWLHVAISESDIAWARAERRKADARHGARNVFTRRKSDAPWLHVLMEDAFGRWLRQESVPGEQISTTRSPSWRVGGQTVSLRIVRRYAPMQLAYGCQISAKHATITTDWWFFGTLVFAGREAEASLSGDLLLLGGISGAEFGRHATVRLGEVTSSYRLRGGHEIHEVSAADLVPARYWPQRLAPPQPPAEPPAEQGSLL